MSNRQPDIIWQPQPGPQTDFCASSVFEALYGGSAGGGKSDGLLMGGLRQVHIPDYRAIVFRRKIKQLDRLIDRSREIFPKAFPGAEWKDSKKVWVFPSGALYKLWHMEDEKNMYDHDGQEYQYIGFDELTHFLWSQYKYLYSRCRTSNPKLDCYIRASAMPIGIGINWVKQRFIDNGPYKVITDEESGLERVFIPAKLEDNKALTTADPAYDRRLRLMGPKLYRALRNGDWSVVEGAVFEELDPAVHMVKPHVPHEGALTWRSLDWGYAKPFSVGWYYENHDKQIVKFREWYGWNGNPDVGLRMGAREVAREIKKVEADLKENCGVSVSYGVADPACWSKIDDAPSIYENFRDEGILFEPAINDRVQGWMEFHNRLVMEDGTPGMLVTENCKHFWRTIPMLQPDRNKPEDVDTKMEDHVGDETRYSIMSRPVLRGAGLIDFGDDRATANQDFSTGDAYVG